MKTFMKVFGWMLLVWCIPLIAIVCIVGIILDLIECVKYREFPDVTDYARSFADALVTGLEEYRKIVDEQAEQF